jgi:hypothetical protein
LTRPPLAGFHPSTEALRDEDPDVRAYLIGKLMRQAKPDDVFEFVRVSDIVALWPRVERHLGRAGRMWRWVLARWNVDLPEPG